MAKSAVHLVSQMLKDACFSRYLLAFIPFSSDESVLRLYFLCDPSNGILSADWFLSGGKKILFSHLLLCMLRGISQR